MGVSSVSYLETMSSDVGSPSKKRRKSRIPWDRKKDGNIWIHFFLYRITNMMNDLLRRSKWLEASDAWSDLAEEFVSH